MMDAARVPLAADMPNPAVSWAYRTQAWGAALWFAAFRALPVDAASGIGGSLARWIGPALGISKRARLNLAAAMPELSAADIDNIIRGMWDNLGRIAAEYPHLRDIRVFAPGGRVESSGFEHVDRALAEGRRRHRRSAEKPDRDAVVELLVHEQAEMAATPQCGYRPSRPGRAFRDQLAGLAAKPRD